MRVEDIMTINVLTCLASDDATVAARIMWEHDCGVVPVVDADNRPIGMVTDRDLCMAAYTRGCALHEIIVDTVKSRSIAVCKTSDQVTTAERIMREQRVRRLPVVDKQGKLVGILSINDVVAISAASDVDVTKTLAAICEARPTPTRKSSRPSAPPPAP